MTKRNLIYTLDARDYKAHVPLLRKLKDYKCTLWFEKYGTSHEFALRFATFTGDANNFDKEMKRQILETFRKVDEDFLKEASQKLDLFFMLGVGQNRGVQNFLPADNSTQLYDTGGQDFRFLVST